MKRANNSLVMTPPAKRSRSCLTPSSQFIEQTVVEKSPAVAVRTCTLHMLTLHPYFDMIILQVVIKRKNSSTVHRLTPSMKKLAKSIGRHDPNSIARQVMSHSRVKTAVIKKMSRVVCREMEDMCKINTHSILRDSSPETLKAFNWDVLIHELNSKAPTFIQLLQGFLHTKKRRRSYRCPPKKSNQTPEKIVIGVCASIILRHRNIHMNLLQRLVSVVLYSGHTNKQVCIVIALIIACNNQLSNYFRI